MKQRRKKTFKRCASKYSRISIPSDCTESKISLHFLSWTSRSINREQSFANTLLDRTLNISMSSSVSDWRGDHKRRFLAKEGKMLSQQTNLSKWDWEQMTFTLFITTNLAAEVRHVPFLLINVSPLSVIINRTVASSKDVLSVFRYCLSHLNKADNCASRAVNTFFCTIRYVFLQLIRFN